MLLRGDDDAKLVGVHYGILSRDEGWVRFAGILQNHVSIGEICTIGDFMVIMLALEYPELDNIVHGKHSKSFCIGKETFYLILFCVVLTPRLVHLTRS